LDQLERRYCKDTPFFRPFYIGAPKGPFLPGLKFCKQMLMLSVDSLAVLPSAMSTWLVSGWKK
jgi:hypothetical protein